MNKWFIECLNDDGSWSRLNEADPDKIFNNEWMLAHYDPLKWRVVHVQETIVWPSQ